MTGFLLAIAALLLATWTVVGVAMTLENRRNTGYVAFGIAFVFTQVVGAFACIGMLVL